MSISPSTALMLIPQFAQTVGGSSMIFGPMLGLLGLSAALICCFWWLSKLDPHQTVNIGPAPAVRVSWYHQPQPPAYHDPSRIHHHGDSSAFHDHGIGPSTGVHGHS